MKKESNPIKSGRRLEVYSDAAKVLDARTMYQHVTLCIKCTALCLRSTHYTTHKQQTCFIIKCSYMENVCACVYSLSNFHIRSQVYVRVYVLQHTHLMHTQRLIPLTALCIYLLIWSILSYLIINAFVETKVSFLMPLSYTPTPTHTAHSHWRSV